MDGGSTVAVDELRVRGRIRRGGLDLTVDLRIEAGLTALVAPNGAGKTSVLRVIAGLDALSSGELVIDGDVVDRPAAARFVPPEERPVAMAFQEPRLFPHLSVLDNIAYPLRRRGLGTAAARERAHALAIDVGMSDLSGERPAALSGGQAQRVNLARAMAAGGATLLLDEPLASIDERARADMRRCIAAAGSTRVVWVTHDPADLDHVDQVISLADVVQTDRP